MKQMILPAALLLILGAGPALAETEPGDGTYLNDDIVAGSSLLEQGAKILLRGIMAEVDPALDDMAQALHEAEPMLRELMAVVGDIRNYQMPEVLPNGDILIRRKTAEELAATPEGEIEL